MRKRNHTVTIRMNKEEYELLQSKVKESGRTQQEVVIKAIADLKIASTEEVEELKRLNQMFADILSQLRGATTNINQIARKLHTDGEVWVIRILAIVAVLFIVGILMVIIMETIKQYKKMWNQISQMFLIGSLSGIAVIGDVIRGYLPVNLILLFVFVNMGIVLLRVYRAALTCN